MAGSSRISVEDVRDLCRPLSGSSEDYDDLVQRAGDCRLVLLGEASHGTHEFYAARARITRRLIEEKGFNAVAVEADWPDAYRVNRFVRGFHDDEGAADALAGFKRFPQWMWRNADILDFVGWLREYNDTLPPERKAGFYGMDLYSLYGSIQAVLEYLDRVDRPAAARARYRYGCFGHFGEDPQAYGYAAGFDLGRSCEQQVIQQLLELRGRASDYARRDGRVAADEYFFAEQNARLIQNAEEYYRQMFHGRESSWNLRDRHMAQTLEALAEHLQRGGIGPKIVVWAHNSHLGDARATEMGEGGELNVGQLLRERHRRDAYLVGFTTHAGHVTAASDWDAPAERKVVRPSLEGSYERLFHDAQVPQFLLDLRDSEHAAEALAGPRLERAIGVVYRPKTERISHYFFARLPEQFDALIHFDQTRAVEPLERTAAWQDEEVHQEVPEAFPSGL
jgi:erythromycin esterase-like protein